MSNVFVCSDTPQRAAATPDGLSGVLDGIHSNVSRDNGLEGVKLGVLLSAAGRRSFGPVLLIIGLFAISPATILPGMTSLTALVILLIALQMALGFRRPWLPKAVLDIKAPRQALFDFLDGARPKLNRVDGHWLRPRVEFLMTPPFVNLVALCVAAAALVTLPLSLIPFAPLAPGLAIVMFGLGMTVRDGVWLLLGVLATSAALWLALPMLL